ncbi:alpha/beta hydrolase [Maricaulis maris]|uniref:Acetyl esterase n=1 Tax=Maricaulis maris TaxID=74318 RepID=A0A495DLN0_9PROT|nr:alpha/beta hydrolase fold domain-containing protein [Maricaulis maris]RKR03818.1 acetyl esterase [Maricaulis maris]
MWFRPYTTRPVPLARARPRPLSKGAQAFLDATPPDAPPIRDLPLDEARAAISGLMTEVDQPGPRMKSVEPATGPVVEGQVADLRVYEPRGRARGVLVFFHGGGCVLGNLDAYDGFARRLAVATRHVVASVGYPLSPENKYPTAIHAGLSALAWAGNELARRGLSSLALAGDSAGGTMAAALALRARDIPQVTLSHLALFYPVMLVPDLPEHGSRQTLGDGRYFLAREDVAWSAGNYLDDPELARLPDVSPLLADGFAGLPPVTVITAGYDPLRDEGADFVCRVRRAGGRAGLYCFENTLHGFMGLSHAMPESAQAFKLLRRRFS